MKHSPHNSPVPDSIQRQWWLTVCLYVLAMLSTVLALRMQWEGFLLIQWGAVAGLVLVYELWLVRRNLHLNHLASEGLILPYFGWGTSLTLFRGLTYGLLAGFFLTPRPTALLAWLPALLYTLAGIADYFDGYAARRTNHVTALGELLDLEFDALGLLVVVGIAVHFGQLPMWYLLVGLARYIFVFGLKWLQRRHKPTYELPSSYIRRVLAGLQMGLMSVILWPIVTPELATLVGVVFALPFLVVFLRDWLVVSGTLAPHASRYLATRDTTTRILVDWLPLALRLLTVLAIAALLLDTLLYFEEIVAAFATYGFSSPDGVVALFMLIELVAIPFVVLGVAARFFALLLIIPLGFTILVTGFRPEATIALLSCLYMLIFGTGEKSLWKPEDRLFERQAGEQVGEETQ